MASYASDEEQLEAIKRWWQENGTSLIVGVVIVLVVFFGSRQWQAAQVAKAGEASDLFETMMPLVATIQSSTLSDQSLAIVESSYDVLRNEHPNSIYTRYGALLMGSVYVSQDEYEQAAAELNWILENPDIGFLKSAEEELFLTARLRLARVRLAQGQAQQALDLVTAVEPLQMAAGYAEVQGDAYVELGQPDQARAAYERAMALDPQNAGLIELKLLGLDG